MKIKLIDLEKFILDTLKPSYQKEEAELIKNVIMFGELSGKPTHGILRLLKKNYGVFVEGTPGKPVYTHKSSISTLIDGKGNPGMLVGPLAMKETLRLAKEHGIGLVGTKNSINSTGALSYYCEQIAKENLIAVIFTQCSPVIAPFSIKTSLFGTNPLAFGFPADPHPLIFDMSTSAIAFGAIAKLKSEGKQLPEYVAVDKEGNMTTDPEKVESTLPFDNSYKGSGLAMIIEILGGLLPGASFAGINTEDGWGNLYLAFSPSLLSDLDSFKKKINAIRETIKSAETRDGKPTRIPGEKTLITRDENIKKGEIEVNDTIIAQIKQQTK